MSRYIDGRKAIDRIREGLLKKMLEDKTENCFEYARLNIWAKEWLNELPTADVAEVKHGRWIETRIWGGRNYKCSVCDFDFTVDLCMGRPMWHYCPNCGAKMDEVEE